MNNKILKAGFGKGVIDFSDELFPVEGFYKVEDAPFARLMVLEAANTKFAIASLELVNVAEDGIELCRDIIEEYTNTPLNHIWVHVTHAISTMHEPGPMGPPDKRPPETEDDKKKKALYYQAIEKAMRQASEDAANDMSDVKIGWGVGECDANVNRDVLTEFGWWTGANPDEPSNKNMSILKVEDLNGKTKGFFISYGIKPCAIDNAGMKEGNRVVSSDVCGVCSRMVEEKYGVPALFGVSAAADQIPKETAFMEKAVGVGQRPEFVELPVEKGLEFVSKYGKQMGEDALSIAENIKCSDCNDEIRFGKVSFEWKKKARAPMAPRPAEPLQDDGDDTIGAEIFTLGDAVFVAEKPEVCCQTEKELLSASPFSHTILICMVNGGQKYMPNKLAYERNTFEAQSSFFQPGAAEKFVEVVSKELDVLQNTLPADVAESKTITECFPDGQKMTGVILKYNKLIDAKSVTAEDYSISNREVSEVYVTDEEKPGKPAEKGCYVVVKIKVDRKRDKTLLGRKMPKHPPKGMIGEPNGAPKPPMPPKKGPDIFGRKGLNSTRRAIYFDISQNKDIKASDGTVINKFGPVRTTGVCQEMVDEFKHLSFDGMHYALYVPKIEAGKKYPLVMFIPDATGGGDTSYICLEQGNGAINFASDEDQKRHPAFVLGIQYNLPGPFTRDDFTINERGVEQVYNVLTHVLNEYPVDTDRIYVTGQSMGCMTSCELNIRYPELFAASLLVAGQWDPEKMGKLYKKNFWICISENDEKAFPGMNAITKAMEDNGAVIGRYYWNAKEEYSTLNSRFEEAAKDGHNIRYTIFEKDTVVPDDEEPNGHSNHMCTWPVVYNIEALRDWLFTQHK